MYVFMRKLYFMCKNTRNVKYILNYNLNYNIFIIISEDDEDSKVGDFQSVRY